MTGIYLKNKEEIETMKKGGEKLAKVLDYVLENLKPGVVTSYLDALAEQKILELGGEPSFKMVPRYHWATCVTINDEVVHGIPRQRTIKEGDVVGVDVGIYYQGFHTDMAETVKVGKKGDEREIDTFLEAGKNALHKAIGMARVGGYLGEISKAIEEEVRKNGFSPVSHLTGHGVGRMLHEEPLIPCFLSGPLEKTPKLKEGMTLAIEVIYNFGGPEVVLASDGWTIRTKDGKISGLFERTIAVTAAGPVILTQ